jgi:hypothetical protein
MNKLLLYLFDGNLNKEFSEIKVYIEGVRPHLNKSIFKGLFTEKLSKKPSFSNFD